MNAALKTAPRTFPARIADLGFTVELPVDWVAHELPAETPDFSDPTTFCPLAVVIAPHAALILSFAARPAYDDGTLPDWALYCLEHNRLRPRAVGRGVVAGAAAVVGEATQDSDLGPLVVRFAFFEDGGRLVNLTFTAPELLAEAVRNAWFTALQSFRLTTPRGSRFPLEQHPDLLPVAPAAEPASERSPVPAPPPAAEEPAGEAFAALNRFEVPQPAATPRVKCRFHDFALAADAASLDPENPLNRNLRDGGAGLVPPVVDENASARRATIAAGSILAQCDVPFGWHALDDGKRLLVFEPSGEVQIHMHLLPREGRDNERILDALEEQLRADYPAPEFVRVTDGPIRGLGVRGIADGDQPLEQLHLLFPFRDDTMVLRARVTAVPAAATEAGNLAGLILASCVFATPEAAATEKRAADGLPGWWTQALALEAQDKLEAAERVIRDGCQHMGFAASTAELYRRRMHRLKAAGDQTGARTAFRKASEFITFYASMATSGGEGAALSLERDQFRARLVAEFGSDPEARHP